MSSLKTSIIIDVVNRATEPIRRISRSLGQFHKTVGPAVSDVGNRFSTATREVGALAGKLALIGGAGAWAFKSQLIDTASEFEGFKAVLETVEGSSLKAQKSMDWVSTFAAKTPYELGEVMDSFVKLRAYGLDPTNGLLKTLGDTSSAMGKPLTQAVEAMADAVTGEYERLKEFGVKASTKGNKTSFAYTDADGKQRLKAVDKNNRALIQSTLMTIWNERYAGAMDKQSRTWRGMMSNLSDQWTRFKIKIMGAGLFDWMKTKLDGLLKLVDKMANNGDLDRLANLWGKKLKAGMEEAWKIGKQLWEGLKQIKNVTDTVAKALGGYDRLLMLVASTMAIKAVVSVVSLGASLFNLGSVALPAAGTAFKAFALVGTTSMDALSLSAIKLTASLAPILVGVAALTALAALLYPIAEGSEAAAKALTEKHVKGQSTDALRTELARNNVMGGGPNSFQSKLMKKELDSRMAGLIDLKSKIPGAPSTKWMQKISKEQLEAARGEVKIKIESAAPVSVTGMKSKNMDLTVDTGRIMKGF